MVPQDKKDAIVNLYASNIDVEFISMQVDLDIPTVITILKELGIYMEKKASTWVKQLSLFAIYGNLINKNTIFEVSILIIPRLSNFATPFVIFAFPL